jgi:putative peptidoglycan lipid II flippase
LFWGVQIPVFLRRRIAERPQLALRLAGLRELAALMWPRVITVGIVQAVDLIFIRLASPLPGGSISAHAYAFLIMVAMPKSLFGSAISTVVFPTLAEQHNTGDGRNLSRTAQRALQAVWALTIPGAVGLLALGTPAVAFLLQRGAFDARATTLVYTLLAIFALRLVAETTQDILFLPFYARHNTRVPMWVSLGWMVVNVSLSYLLVKPLGIHGLAWAATIAVIASVLALYWLNRRLMSSFNDAALARNLGRILLACVCMAGAILPLHWLALDALPFLVLGIGLGGLVYLVVYGALSGRELSSALALVAPVRWAAISKRLALPPH